MSEPINWCNLKENIKHVGEVSTSRQGGSPSGKRITTSKNAVTGDVRDTLDGRLDKISGVYIGEYKAGLTFSSYAEYVVYNGQSYKPKSATTLPFTTTNINTDLPKLAPFDNAKLCRDYEEKADASADRAEAAAEAAAASGKIYPTVEAGIAATSDNELFLVVSDSYSGFSDLYLNDGGAGVFQGKTTINIAALDPMYIQAMQFSAVRMREKSLKNQSAPIAPVIILLGQSLNAARGVTAQKTAACGKMLTGGCHVSTFDFWSKNATWSTNYADVSSVVNFAEGDEQTPCSGILNAVIGGDIKQAYIANIAVGARDIATISSGGVKQNLYATVHQLCSFAVADGYSPRVVFYSAHGEADAHIQNANYAKEAAAYYKMCQLVAAQAMQDINYRAPVILTKPIQNNIPDDADIAIASAISDIAKSLVNGIDAGAIYQWSVSADRVHPTEKGYIQRGEHVGDIINKFFSTRTTPQPLEMTDAHIDGTTVTAVFSDNVVRDDSCIAGTALNTDYQIDGFEFMDGDDYAKITTTEYLGRVVKLTLESAPVTTNLRLRIACQRTDKTLKIGAENHSGSQVRKNTYSINSIFDPAHIQHQWANKQEIKVRAL